MRGQPRYTDKEITETISPEEWADIDDKVMKQVSRIWDSTDIQLRTPLFDFCSYCDNPMRQRVIVSALDLSCECSSCYAKRRERELIEELMDEKMKAKKPALDIADFARL